MVAEYPPFAVANDLLADPETLRARIREDGYLFFRGLGPKDRIISARRDILELLRDEGWVKRDAGPLSATWSGIGPYIEGQPEYMAVYKKVLHLPAFLAVPEDASLTKIVGAVLGGPVQLHRLRIGRIVFPGRPDQSVAEHQDYHYISGTPDTYTVWMPLGDCPHELGGLAVMRGSHKGGFRTHAPMPGKKFAVHGVPPESMPTEGVQWHTNPFELGDFLIFHSHTIHKAMPNVTPDTIRLSTDNRFQREGEAIAPHSLRTHYNL